MTSVLNVDTIADKAGTGPVGLTKQHATKAWATQTTHGGAFLGSFNYSSSTDNATGEATYSFTNSMNDANYSVNATHYNRAAGSGDPSHHTTSSHKTSWWQPSGGAKSDVVEKGSIQVCGDLA